jgi:Glycosyltransferase family 87
LARGWGSSTAIRYLVLGLPLVVFVYMRLDLVSVCLATAAAFLLRRDRERASGVTLAAAVLFRLWPVVVFPILFIRRRARAALWGIATLALGGIAWVLWGGTDAIRQVVTFRGATGWGIGSTVGSVLWSTGRPIVFEAGAYRVGTVGAARYVLVAALVVLLVAIWVRAARSGSDPAGRPALGAVAALLFCSPLLSDSYVAWLLPWAAVAANEERWATRAVFAVCLAQAVPYLVSGHLPVAGSQVLDLLRIPLLGFIVATWLFIPAPRAAEERSDVEPVATPRS